MGQIKIKLHIVTDIKIATISHRNVHHKVHQLKDDPKWVSRLEQYFGFIDKDRDGIITIEQVQQWATQLERQCSATPTQMVALRALLYTFWGGIGLKPDVMMTKDQFLEGVNTVGMEDKRKQHAGEPTMLG